MNIICPECKEEHHVGSDYNNSVLECPCGANLTISIDVKVSPDIAVAHTSAPPLREKDSSQSLYIKHRILTFVIAVSIIGIMALTASFQSDKLKSDAPQSPEAQHAIGNSYSSGEEVPQDMREAFKWYKASAKQGYEPAQLSLAGAYYFGEGTSRDYVKAVNLLKILAEKGKDKSARIGSQYLLGCSYFDGNGVKRDYLKATRWFKKAAKQGHSHSQVYLGEMYQKGLGVIKDLKASLMWFTVAALDGDVQAQEELGNIYHKGIGVKVNLKEAMSWYKKAAKQGSQRAKALYENLKYPTHTQQSYDSRSNQFIYTRQ